MPDSTANIFDQARVYVRAGRGGDGAASFRREKPRAAWRTDGGDGGRGGDVLIRARENLHALTHLQYRHRFIAGNRAPGQRSLRQGRDGKLAAIDVPLGTVVYDDATSQVLHDLVEVDQVEVVAHGGQGGRGNARFKSSRFTAPDIALRGAERRRIPSAPGARVDRRRWSRGRAQRRKVLALDPSQRRRPKVAPYPFTTLQPVLGVVVASDTHLVVADLPGLIEGASEGAGLGAQFLAHARRSRVLIHVVDGSGLERPPVEALDAIDHELASHGAGLESRPQIVAFNKIDLAESRAEWSAFAAECRARGSEPVAVSAATGDGMATLIQPPWAHWPKLRSRLRPQLTAPPVLRPEPVTTPRACSVAPTGPTLSATPCSSGWRDSLKLDTPDAVDYFQRRLDRSGVTARLEKAGAEPGDTVVIGELEFEWEAEGL